MIKNQDEKIKILLTELYKIDLSLKKHEKALVKIIKKLIAIRPDTQFDEEFKRELRMEIMQRIAEIKEAKAREKAPIFGNVFKLGTPLYALSGMLLLLAIVIAGSVYYGSRNVSSNLDFSKLSIHSVREAAFGSLKGGSNTIQSPTDSNGVGTTGIALNKDQSEIAPAPVVGKGGGGGNALAVMPPYEHPITYRYVYQGEDLSLDENQIEVLRRQKGTGSGIALMSVIKKINFGLADIGSFDSASVDNMSFTQNKPYGYTVSLSFSEGMLSIYKNWQQWENNNSKCISGIKCVPIDSEPLTLNDVPSDEALIAIADNFVKEHGFDLKLYGAPEINKNWQMFETQIASGDIAVPMEIQVIYPLMINGLYVYETSGTKYGITVSIDIQNKKVASIYNLTFQTYDKSSYEVADKDSILKYAEVGGMGRMYFDNQENAIEVPLGTPSKAYVKY